MEIQLKSAVKMIAAFIEEVESLNNKDLIEICRANGTEMIGGQNETHLIHELLEAAIN